MLSEAFPVVRTFTPFSLLDSSVFAKGLNPQSALAKMPGNETRCRANQALLVLLLAELLSYASGIIHVRQVTTTLVPILDSLLQA